MSICPEVVVGHHHYPDEVTEETLAGGRQLLVLVKPDPAALDWAKAALDRGGLPRWAIVAIDSDFSDGVLATAAGRKSQHLELAKEFGQALVLHETQRQMVRRSGDLLTLSTRITHDFRTSLGNLLSGCELMKELAEERVPLDASLAKSLLESANSQATLLNRVSQLIKASESPRAFEEVEMSEIVWTAWERLEKQLPTRIATVTQPSSWPKVLGVAAWLEVIWWNLLSNAAQYGGDPPRIEIGWIALAQEYEFWVEDRGLGVVPERINDLFQPFNLLYQTNARKGIGLSIVQRLVELQGGRCSYKLRPGGGSRFVFMLPVLPG